jgi:hypothetical protein
MNLLLKQRLKDAQSCLADYFTWPQVALTHHALSTAIETSNRQAVNSPKILGSGVNVWCYAERADTFWAKVAPAAQHMAVSLRLTGTYPFEFRGFAQDWTIGSVAAG